MKKGQSGRLTAQQKEGQGPITIFHKDAQFHDKEVGNTSMFVIKQGEGGHWNDKDMILVMLEVARTSLKMLGTDLFEQLTKK